jgi:hypothetical protein
VEFFGYAQIILQITWHFGIQATTVAMEMQQCILFA